MLGDVQQRELVEQPGQRRASPSGTPGRQVRRPGVEPLQLAPDEELGHASAPARRVRRSARSPRRCRASPGGSAGTSGPPGRAVGGTPGRALPARRCVTVSSAPRPRSRSQRSSKTSRHDDVGTRHLLGAGAGLLLARKANVMPPRLTMSLTTQVVMIWRRSGWLGAGRRTARPAAAGNSRAADRSNHGSSGRPVASTGVGEGHLGVGHEDRELRRRQAAPLSGPPAISASLGRNSSARSSPPAASSVRMNRWCTGEHRRAACRRALPSSTFCS